MAGAMHRSTAIAAATAVAGMCEMETAGSVGTVRAAGSGTPGKAMTAGEIGGRMGMAGSGGDRQAAPVRSSSGLLLLANSL